MGMTTGPRSPAVHRGALVLDAISSGAATTPAALSASLALPKSSVADLLGTLTEAGFVARDGDGALHPGAQWGALSDPDAVAERVFRACATVDLDGHTVSLVRLFGNQVVFVDVRPGRHPLPLTPRPGQRANAVTCAGSVAIVSSLTAVEAAEVVRTAAAHLDLSDEEVQHTLALRQSRRRTVYETHSPLTGRQLACPVSGTRLALVLHVPERLPQPATRKAVRALTSAAEEF